MKIERAGEAKAIGMGVMSFSPNTGLGKMNGLSYAYGSSNSLK